MIEEELRAAFARHEPMTPPAGPVRAAIDRLARVRRRRRQRLQATGVGLALAVVLSVGLPQLAPDRTVETPPIGRSAAGTPAGPLNLLLVGTDGTADLEGLRADSVLLVHVPADRSRPYLVSLPRDLMVPIPGHGEDKLNSAFAYGAGPDRPDLRRGYDLIRRVVSDLTGVRVDAGAVLTYPALRRLTDAVDGVEVCLPWRIESFHTDRVFPAGCQRLGGAAAVDLLRQRRTLPDGGHDRDRVAQRYAAGLLRRAAEQEVLTDPVRLLELVRVVDADLVVGEGGHLADLVGVLPRLGSTEPVGLSLPVRETTRPVWRMTLHPQQGPDFLTALREDRLAEWAERNPDAVNSVR